MRILITNDDGINATGLSVLYDIAKRLSDDVWIVAPEANQSGVSRALTLHQPLRMRKHDEKKFSVQGTPTDCVLMGVDEVLKGEKPDLILSGVNRGQNLADDVTYSGTVAGAMEGAILGVPSIALSQSFNFAAGGKMKWQTADALGADLVKKLIDQGWPEDVLININFPDREPDDIEGFEITRQGKRDQNIRKIDVRQDTAGQNYYWYDFRRVQYSLPEGTDLWAVNSGYVSITPLFLNLTHDQTCDALKNNLFS